GIAELHVWFLPGREVGGAAVGAPVVARDDLEGQLFFWGELVERVLLGGEVGRVGLKLARVVGLAGAGGAADGEDAERLEARGVAPVAFLVRPALVVDGAFDEDGRALLEVGDLLGELVPGG